MEGDVGIGYSIFKKGSGDMIFWVWMAIALALLLAIWTFWAEVMEIGAVIV